MDRLNRVSLPARHCVTSSLVTAMLRYTSLFACGLRLIGAWLLGLLLALGHPASAAANESIIAQTHYWIDVDGQTTFAQVQALPRNSFQLMGTPRSFELIKGALWLRYDLPVLEVNRRWYLLLEGPSYTNRATLYQQDVQGQWHMQEAGDHLPMSQWTRPDLVPTFTVTAQPHGTVWLRLENFPSTLNPGLSLLDDRQLEVRRNTTLLFLGTYLGFGLLVLFLGWVHVGLYGDRVFVAYVVYVACMLGFQISFTGLGALFFWPELSRWSDSAPAIFVCWLTASGIWFVREIAVLYRHDRAFNRFVFCWSVLGIVYPAVYLLFQSPVTFKLLNLYGFLSVLLSMTACVWAWRKGEVYAGWAALGFLPLHLSYPFAALRAAGVLSDSWVTQYAVLIGSAIEIPLLLYILHRRARDFSENRARMRAIESTDPLTGLTITPVLILRLGDAVRRARRNRSNCGLALVELANHDDLVAQEGRPTADRALVTAASQLTALVRDVDTVCRVSENRFAVLLEAPYRGELLKHFAQHIVATGLARLPWLPSHQCLRYRVATLALPDWASENAMAEELDVARMVEHLNRELDQMDPKRIVIHLPLPPAMSPEPPATAAA